MGQGRIVVDADTAETDHVFDFLGSRIRQYSLDSLSVEVALQTENPGLGRHQTAPGKVIDEAAGIVAAGFEVVGPGPAEYSGGHFRFSIRVLLVLLLMKFPVTTNSSKAAPTFRTPVGLTVRCLKVVEEPFITVKNPIVIKVLLEFDIGVYGSHLGVFLVIKIAQDFLIVFGFGVEQVVVGELALDGSSVKIEGAVIDYPAPGGQQSVVKIILADAFGIPGNGQGLADKVAAAGMPEEPVAALKQADDFPVADQQFSVFKTVRSEPAPADGETDIIPLAAP